MVLGCGALNLDLFYEVADLSLFSSFGISPGGEVWGGRKEFLRLKERLSQAKLIHKDGGGSAANTIFTLSLLGFKTAFVGRVGPDPEGQEVLRLFGEVGKEYIEKRGQTALCLSLIGPQRDRALFVCPNPEEGIPEDFRPPLGLRHLHLSSFATPSGLSGQLDLICRLPHGVSLSFDPGEIYASKGLETILPLLKRARIVFITQRELELLNIGLQGLHDLGIEVVVVKKGAKGAEISIKAGKIPVPPARVDRIVETTGAGDAFDAGFLAGWLRGLDLYTCGQMAAKLAALSLTGYGREGLRRAKRLKEEVFS